LVGSLNVPKRNSTPASSSGLSPDGAIVPVLSSVNAALGNCFHGEIVSEFEHIVQSSFSAPANADVSPVRLFKPRIELRPFKVAISFADRTRAPCFQLSWLPLTA
jgi:hypothetical protein